MSFKQKFTDLLYARILITSGNCLTAITCHQEWRSPKGAKDMSSAEQKAQASTVSTTYHEVSAKKTQVLDPLWQAPFLLQVPHRSVVHVSPSSSTLSHFPPSPPNHLHQILWNWHPESTLGADLRRPLNRTGKVTSTRVSHFLKAWHRAYLLYPSRVKILCKTVKVVDRHNKNGPRKKWTVSSAIKKETGNNCNNSGFSTMIDADQRE